MGSETEPKKVMRRIPISAARHVAEVYGYDQVIIYARKIGANPDPHGEHLTTYGVTKAHCGAIAKIGDYLKRVMGWEPQQDTAQ